MVRPGAGQTNFNGSDRIQLYQVWVRPCTGQTNFNGSDQVQVNQVLVRTTSIGQNRYKCTGDRSDQKWIITLWDCESTTSNRMFDISSKLRQIGFLATVFAALPCKILRFKNATLTFLIIPTMNGCPVQVYKESKHLQNKLIFKSFHQQIHSWLIGWAWFKVCANTI